MESKTRTVGATILLVAKVVNLLEEDEIESSISWDDHLKRLVVECLDISELQLHPSPYLAKSASGTVICFEGWSDDEQRKVQKAFLHITGTNPGYGTRVEWGASDPFQHRKNRRKYRDKVVARVGELLAAELPAELSRDYSLISSLTTVEGKQKICHKCVSRTVPSFSGEVESVRDAPNSEMSHLPGKTAPSTVEGLEKSLQTPPQQEGPRESVGDAQFQSATRLCPSIQNSLGAVFGASVPHWEDWKRRWG